MLNKISTEYELNEALEYIGDRFKTTPYLYVNLIKYGLGTENVSAWIDRNGAKIEGLFLLYYDCIHFFTRDVKEYPVERLMSFVKSTDHKVLMFQEGIGDRLDNELSAYYSERNHIIDMDNVGIKDEQYAGEIAGREDIPEIVELFMSDPEYINVYDRNVLLNQMLDRFDGDFSRYFILRSDGRVVATCSTYGEVPGFALVGGVIVHPSYRRRGLASSVENYACHVLANEGISRVGFVNVNNTASLILHEKLGAYSVSKLAKFIKK